MNVYEFFKFYSLVIRSQYGILQYIMSNASALYTIHLTGKETISATIKIN